MRAIFGLVFIAGLALAGFAVYMVQKYVGQNQAELTQERAFRAKLGPVVEVYVAKEALVYGAPLTRDDVRKVLMPKNNLPESVFTDEAALFPGDYLKPRFVVRQMEKSEPILAVKVTEPGEDAGLTARLAKGMRAFAIKVDVASGVSGFLQPGDNVDIYWTGTTRDIEGEMTRLIEGSVQIVAVDQIANSERSSGALVARTVTVEVTPQQVARLAQAQATGRLALSLVGQGDVAASGVIDVDSRSLLGIVIEQQAQVEVEKVCSVKTRRGADVVEIPIPCTN
ncbi:MAG: Flp pilus assembly protein CpaB [Paracoccaceae bacterium]|nr:MAG: Flp pilus assembly protein CpaB [Paracoccaceae bacterium]